MTSSDPWCCMYRCIPADWALRDDKTVLTSPVSVSPLTGTVGHRFPTCWPYYVPHKPVPAHGSSDIIVGMSQLSTVYCMYAQWDICQS